MSDEKLDQLAEIIPQRVKSKMPPQINWEKVGKVAVIVACGAGFVALTVASAGTVAIGAGATAASLGASSAVVSTVSTAATIGTYTVAGGIAATTVCDAEEVITDGHNTIRDNMIAPLAGPEHASEIYNNSKLMLTLASLGITQFAADNPQFRPLSKNKNLQAQIKPNLEPKANPDLKLQTENELNSKTLLEPDIQLFAKEAETEVETVMKDAKGLFHGEDGQFVSLKKAQEASEAGKLIDKSGKVIKLEDKIELTFENSAANALSTPDSEALGKNMEAAGIKRPSYPHAAHHIVAGSDPRAADARKVLEKFEININAAENGVYLPTVKGVSKAAYHPSLHTDVYYKKVNKILSDAKSREDVLEFLSDIAQDLLNGKF